MRDYIEKQLKDAWVILDRSNLPEKTKRRIVSIIEDLAYKWCRSNAVFTAFDHRVQEFLTEDQYIKCCSPMQLTPIIMEMERKTFPEIPFDDESFFEDLSDDEIDNDEIDLGDYFDDESEDDTEC